MFNNYTVLQGVDKIVAVDIYVPGCPPRPEALMEGIIRLHEAVQAGVPPAYSCASRDLNGAWDGVPALLDVREAHGETTLVVETATLVETCTHLRDERGFNFLSDLSAADYLGWADDAGRRLHRHDRRRDINDPMTQGLSRLPHCARPSGSRSSTSSRCDRALHACASRSGSTTASTSRASSGSGRPPTGTSGRRGT